uniref:Calreticulin n=1 Tax=Oryzias sinensis TaxID=183150 RepID=A0A8C7YC49_9TELE
MTAVSLLLMAVCATSVLAESSVYFREQFEDGDAWKSRWIESKHKSDYGQFVLTEGKFYGDGEKDKGLQTSQDAHFYASSARFDDFSNKGQPLVLQFTIDPPLSLRNLKRNTFHFETSSASNKMKILYLKHF